jgi:hypothetical protein
MKDLKSISISKDHAKLLLQTRGNIAVNYTSYLAKNFEDLEEDIILLENDFDVYVYISKLVNGPISDGIQTEDFVLIGKKENVYNALSEMTDDSVNVFDFKEYKFD